MSARPIILSSVGVWMQYTRSVRFSGSSVDSSAARSVSCASTAVRCRRNHLCTAATLLLRDRHSRYDCSSKSQTAENGSGMLGFPESWSNFATLVATG